MKQRILKKYMPQVVYGGVDGTISTFAVVAGAFGGGLSSNAAFILGVASIGADGFSMAVGAYLSAGSDHKRNPRRIGVVTFLAFAILGSFLLIPYLAGQFTDLSRTAMFVASGIFAVASFAFIGVMKAYTDNKSVFSGAREVVLLGVIAAGIAYFLGDFLERIIV